MGYLRQYSFVALLAFNWASAAIAQTYTVLHDFGPASGSDGAGPYSSLIQSGPNLYGYTIFGGIGAGTIFQYNLDTKTESVLYNFGVLDSSEAFDPIGAPLLSGSSLYGMTEGSVPGFGAIFQYNLATNTPSLLHDFAGNPTDGNFPYGSLIQSGTVLYGLTSQGGASPPQNPRGSSRGLGALVEYDLATNTESLLYSFIAPGDGTAPDGSLIQIGSKLYGLTSKGGASNNGTIFQYDLSNDTESVLYSFAGGSESTPYGSLIQSGSKLYGEAGGVIFQYDLVTNTEADLYTFGGSPNDGSEAVGSLIQSGSDLYGMTLAGGAQGDGTVFDYNLATNTETVLHSFAGGSDDGSEGYNSLLLSGSTLYGLTYQGGTNNTGVIFSLTVP